MSRYFAFFCLDFGCSIKAPAYSFDLAWLRAIISIAMVFKQNKKGPSQLRVPSHSQGLLLPQNELWGAHLGAAVITIHLNFSNSGTSAPEIVSSLNKLILKIPHI